MGTDIKLIELFVATLALHICTDYNEIMGVNKEMLINIVFVTNLFKIIINVFSFYVFSSVPLI